MDSETYHEPRELLSDKTQNLHRALVTLREELEAVDWYEQRAEGCTDEELRAVLVHNKNEEIEHAMMVLEWIRRHASSFDANIGVYLNSSGAITAAEASQATANAAHASGAPSVSLGIGSLKAVG